MAADGFTALVEKLGMADAVRFVQLHDPGRGDYTGDRGLWLADLTHDQVADQMARAEASRGTGGT